MIEDLEYVEPYYIKEYNNGNLSVEELFIRARRDRVLFEFIGDLAVEIEE